MGMKENMEERACRLALYIIENKATVRAAARQFRVSKSTVHTEGTKWNGGETAQEGRSPRHLTYRKHKFDIFLTFL